ncbi:uncharacterised protein [Saccharolobus solfataricus]|uniref:Uncharacterized protein n=1 Tax=Saccharolobus solfataricus TaxID=2287 RepID=A0A157T183_SACSO|nr:uncharacterised protein [Saccharolobus solfataricus]
MKISVIIASTVVTDLSEPKVPRIIIFYWFPNLITLQWCFTNFTQNDTISMEEKNIRAELEKSAYFNTRSKKFSYLLKKLTENEFIYKE